MIRLLRTLVVVVALAVLAASCGVQPDSGPTVLARSSLPADLVEGVVPTVAASDEDGLQFQIWMVGPDNSLVSVNRVITFSPEAVMRSLLDGTFPRERAQQISTAITRTTQLNDITINTDGVAFVDLAEGSIISSRPDEQKLAFAQIVWSLTGLPTIERVQFSIGGEFISLPTDDGASIPGQSVDRSDFGSLSLQPSIDFVDETDTGPAPEATAPPVAIPTPDTTVQIPIWMVNEAGNLVRVTRRIERSPEAILSSLLLGPDFIEGEVGVRSALPDRANWLIIDVNEADQTALVDLAPDSLPPASDDDALRAAAQIVFSLTELSEITMVTFTEAGRSISVSTQAGLTQPGQAVSRDDFGVIAPGVLGVVQPTPDPLAVDDEDGDEGASDGSESGESEGAAGVAGSSEADEPSPTAGAEPDPASQASATPTATPTPTPAPTPTSIGSTSDLLVRPTPDGS
jgi:spore germination protein GerM